MNDTFFDDYLAHHGIKGQKWGVRNGPPYPLGEGDHSAAERKHMGGGSTTKKQVKSDRSESTGRSSGGSSKSSSSASKDISRSGGFKSLLDDPESVPKKELAEKFKQAAENGELTKTIKEAAEKDGPKIREKIKTEMDKPENIEKLKKWGPVAAYAAAYIINQVAPISALGRVATVVKIAAPLVAWKYSGIGTAALMVACGAGADTLLNAGQIINKIEDIKDSYQAKNTPKYTYNTSAASNDAFNEATRGVSGSSNYANNPYAANNPRVRRPGESPEEYKARLEAMRRK